MITEYGITGLFLFLFVSMSLLLCFKLLLSVSHHDVMMIHCF